MIRRILAVSVLVTPLLLWGQEDRTPSAAVLSLQQAIDFAMQSNRLVQSAALEVEKSQEAVAAAKTHRLPVFNLYLLESQLLTRVNFDIKQGQFGTFPGIGPVPATSTSISTPLRPTTYIFQQTTQPLSQLHRINLGIQMQEVGTDLAREELRRQRHNVSNAVKQAYYAILQGQSSLESVEESLKFYQELEELMDRYLAQQVVLESDSMNVKTERARTKYQALTLRNQLASGKENLNILLGRELQTEFTVQPVSPETVYEINLEAARRRALEQRPEAREARLKLKQAQLDERAQKARNIPDISFSFNYLSPFNVEFLPKNITSVGLMLNWQPFDWGNKKRELAQKALTSRQSDLGLKDAEQQILLDVDTHYRKLQEARALLEVSQMAQGTEQEKLRVVMNQYKLQAILLKDVLQEQASVSAANNQYQQALLAFWTAKADFEKALGEE
jgi:outer membrane protein TolC